MIPHLLFQLSSGAAAVFDGEVIMVTVPADDRSIGVGAVSRSIAVTADDRSILVPDEREPA